MDEFRLGMVEVTNEMTDNEIIDIVQYWLNNEKQRLGTAFFPLLSTSHFFLSPIFTRKNSYSATNSNEVSQTTKMKAKTISESENDKRKRKR